MTIPNQAYWYNNQLKRYVIQFMTIFSGLQVKVGKNEDTGKDSYVVTTIHYGNHDRVVASLMAENTQNKPVRLPCMTAFMQSLDMAPELMHGIGVERRNTYSPFF